MKFCYRSAKFLDPFTVNRLSLKRLHRCWELVISCYTVAFGFQCIYRTRLHFSITYVTLGCIIKHKEVTSPLHEAYCVSPTYCFALYFKHFDTIYTDKCCDFLSLSFTPSRHTFPLSISKSMVCSKFDARKGCRCNAKVDSLGCWWSISIVVYFLLFPVIFFLPMNSLVDSAIAGTVQLRNKVKT